MRVTDVSMTRNILSNIQGNAEKMGEINERLATGKDVNRPSDDPLKISAIIRSEKILKEQEQYASNISKAESYLSTVESAMIGLTDIVQRVKELAIQASSETYDKESRDYIGKEIASLKEQVGLVANTKLGDRYIFSGADVFTPPYDFATESWVIDPLAMVESNTQVSAGGKVAVSIKGGEIFNGEAGGLSLFDVFDNVVNRIDSQDVDGIRAVSVAELESALGDLVNHRAYIGAKMNSLETIKSRNQQLVIDVTEELSKAADADMIDVVTQMKQTESVYKASLAVGAKVMQMSLLDFLG